MEGYCSHCYSTNSDIDAYCDWSSNSYGFVIIHSNEGMDPILINIKKLYFQIINPSPSGKFVYDKFPLALGCFFGYN